MTRQLTKTIFLFSTVFLTVTVARGQHKIGADNCSGNYKKSWVDKYKSLKKNNSILFQKANNSTDSKGLKQGLWTVNVKHNTHYGSYTCLDTVNYNGKIPFDKPVKIIAKGNYKDNVPTGVWIKYMDKLDSTFYEYLFFKNGDCVKHIYFDHNNCIYLTDSLNKTGDTLISEGDYYSTGKKEKFNIDDNWISPAKGKLIKSVGLPNKDNPYFRTVYYDNKGQISSTVIKTTINDTLIISIYNTADKIDRRQFIDKRGNILKKEKKTQTDNDWKADN